MTSQARETKVYLVYSTDGYDSYLVDIYKTKKSAWKCILHSRFIACERAQECYRLEGGTKGWKYEPYDFYYITEKELYD